MKTEVLVPSHTIRPTGVLQQSISVVESVGAKRYTIQASWNTVNVTSELVKALDDYQCTCCNTFLNKALEHYVTSVEVVKVTTQSVY